MAYLSGSIETLSKLDARESEMASGGLTKIPGEFPVFFALRFFLFGVIQPSSSTLGESLPDIQDLLL